jgi:hypothetical protein
MISNSSTKPVSLAAVSAEMGHFAIRVWDKTQFGFPGSHLKARVDRLLRP